MANLNSNITPKLKSLPEAAGKFFAGINAGIRSADKKAIIEAEARLPDKVKKSISKLRVQIEQHEKTIQANPTKSTVLKLQITNLQQLIDNLLSKNGFGNIYDNLQNEKRIEREESRKRRREPDTVPVPSDADVLDASKEADTAIAAADELLEEPENVLPPPPTTTESVTAPVTAQAEEILLPSPPPTESVPAPVAEMLPSPPPQTEKATADANKLAKVLVDSLLSAAQSSIKMPPAPPLPTEEVEADASAPFAVTAKPQPAPAAAVAETIVNALDDSQNAVELPTTTTPAPVQVTQEPTITAPTTMSPGALANVIVNALKLASTAPPAPVQGTQAQTPRTAPAPVQAQEPAPVPITQPQEPTILPGALATVIVNALKLASTQAVATPETVTATTVVPELSTSPEPEPVTSSVAGVISSESPGFISLIQKYLEPIIGQFSPPKNNPQKVFDKTLLPENMQKILDDANIRYIGRYRTESKSDQNASQTQTTYLFWNTDTHDYTTQTVTDGVNNVVLEEEQAPATVQRTQVKAPKQTRQDARTLGQTQVLTVEKPAQTTKELVDNLPLAPTTDPLGAKQRRTVEPAKPRSAIPLGPMI